MGRGSVIPSSGLDWERFGVITGGDEVCILPPPTLSEKGVGIPTLSITLFFFSTGRDGAVFFFFFRGSGRDGCFWRWQFFGRDGAKSLHRPAKGGLNRPASRPCKALEISFSAVSPVLSPSNNLDRSWNFGFRFLFSVQQYNSSFYPE